MTNPLDQLATKKAKEVIAHIPDKKIRNYFFKQIISSHSKEIQQSQCRFWIEVERECKKYFVTIKK